LVQPTADGQQRFLTALRPTRSVLVSVSTRVAARNREKFTKTPYFGGSRSFKVIDVDISKKLVASAYYGKQYICAYLQPFLR